VLAPWRRRGRSARPVYCWAPRRAPLPPRSRSRSERSVSCLHDHAAMNPAASLRGSWRQWQPRLGPGDGAGGREGQAKCLQVLRGHGFCSALTTRTSPAAPGLPAGIQFLAAVVLALAVERCCFCNPPRRDWPHRWESVVNPARSLRSGHQRVRGRFCPMGWSWGLCGSQPWRRAGRRRSLDQNRRLTPLVKKSWPPARANAGPEKLGLGLGGCPAVLGAK